MYINKNKSNFTCDKKINKYPIIKWANMFKEYLKIH